MKVAEEIIRALYNIRDAIKGNNGASGGGNEQSVDNGLMGADAVAVGYGGSDKSLEIIDNFTDLSEWVINTFNDVSYNKGYGTTIRFLYKNNNFDKLGKPTVGEFSIGEEMSNPELNDSSSRDLKLRINYVVESTIDNYVIDPFTILENGEEKETDYYYLSL